MSHTGSTLYWALWVITLSKHTLVYSHWNLHMPSQQIRKHLSNTCVSLFAVLIPTFVCPLICFFVRMESPLQEAHSCPSCLSHIATTDSKDHYFQYLRTWFNQAPGISVKSQIESPTAGSWWQGGKMTLMPVMQALGLLVGANPVVSLGLLHMCRMQSSLPASVLMPGASTTCLCAGQPAILGVPTRGLQGSKNVPKKTYKTVTRTKPVYYLKVRTQT